jgi:hypothetical protein
MPYRRAKKGSPFYRKGRTNYRMDGTHRTTKMKWGDKESTFEEYIITEKSVSSLKQNPIPYYVKKPTPLIQSAQELGYSLEKRRI